MRGSHEPQAAGLGIHDPSQSHNSTPTQTPPASQRMSGVHFPLPTFITTSPATPHAEANGVHDHGHGHTIRAPRGHDNSRVLDRISALLHKDDHHAPPADASSTLQVPTVQGGGTPTSEPGMHSFEIEFKDRPALKVLVVTWNMGDLSVLLGHVPPYEAPEKTDELCELPVENKHPYHIVVVAAQECPTPSGVPRGLGAGLRKGVIPKVGVEGLRGREPSVALKKEERDAVLKEIRDKGKERKDKDAAAKPLKDKEPATKPSPENGKKPTENGTKRSDSKAGRDRSVSADDRKDAKSDSGHANGSAQGNGNREEARSPKMSPPIKEKELAREMQAPFHTSLDRALDRGLERFKDTIDVAIPSRTRTPNADEPLSPDEEGGALKPSAPKGWSSMLEVPCEATPHAGATPHLPQPPPLLTTPSSASMSVMPLPEIDVGESLMEREASPTPRQTPLPSTSTLSSSSASTPKATPGPSGSMAIPSPANGTSTTSAPALGTSALGTSVLSASSVSKPPMLHHPTPRSHLGASYDSNRFLSPPHDSPMLGRSPTLSRSPVGIDRGDEKEGKEGKEKTYRRPGAGPYVNIIKERLLGMYMSVFVYKGCKHLLEGCDKSYVTAGLAGGRIGNKGGIGVSVNLAGHRLLFVNAHLAAHADKMDARLANIAKIKAELKLNDFLDESDPRKGFEDITDRFDTTFWCGDLNFRVDISQLHAKWLLDQKKYQDALMFDQLRKVMADPNINPLPGFEEAPITFMPTFKYDVWKSMRATNREIKRSIRRSRRERPERMSSDMAGSFTLDGVPELETQPTVLEEGDGEIVSSPIDIGPRHDWQSARSSSQGEHHPSHQLSMDESVASTRPSLSNSARPSSRYRSGTSAAESYKSGFTDQSHHSVAHPISGIKEKSKKLWGMFNLGHKRTPSKARPVTPLSPPARRQSMASFRSSRISAASDEESAISDDEFPFRPFVEDEGGVSRRTSTSTTGSRREARERDPERIERPERPKHTLLRSPSGASFAPGSEDGLDFDDTIDHRVGVYDTSKKQRIPSWCDRVLWKSHVIPDEDDDSLLSYESEEEVGAFVKLSNALTNISERFRRRSSANMEYTGSPTAGPVDEPRAHRASLNPALGMTPAEPNAREHLTTPVPIDSPLSLADEPPLIQEPDTPTPRRSPSDPGQATQPGSVLEKADPAVAEMPHRPRENTTSSDQLRVTIADSPTINGEPVPVPTSASEPMPRRQSTRQRSVTFDGPSADLPVLSDRSALGLSQPSSTVPRRSSRGSVDGPSGPGSRRGSLSRRSSIGSRSVRSTRSTSSRSRRRSESPSFTALGHAKTTSAIPDSVRLRRRSAGASFKRTDSLDPSHPKESTNAFAKFLRDLPGRFHSRVSLFHAEPEQQEQGEEKERPKRHLVGEVQVLHYDTLDDAGMRQLEGRSDHRPAIFAAAVYV
ncbi:hypothetical protein A1Q1_05121 [Trichosporon asahii var. asahii CBS 2479]|uniref:Inositol polyphosphate-related phosphatase domain-containing protein n=1 Tax=Trichosporon asahii var. asahii (strain ATCC 90039 / CBS 2479 / JCM 2466 / KCTC 7840 / NBRC 103889/ NCYC 2677 / UAMH 7654) TaxID=1186058 RepID=J6EU31_TRIAS|nr:hypothetical protein A1Q1_05121 [Trichosporon asahii var. asahii CBS 2479]EJT46292.1 hypothetical protein A1Q1_05121 [Trichosporon asahii var. asahii CBS 2479]